MSAETLTVPARFNGPLDSGNGGYSCGAVAAFAGDPAQVTLRRPVPLDTALEVRREADGHVLILDGGEPVAEGRSVAELDTEVPEPVGVAEAAAARKRYRGRTDGLFCRCFVCGLARADSLGVEPGAVAGRDVVASPWTPPAWTAGESGEVRPEIVWGVLDCPTYFGAYVGAPDPLPPAMLARMSARLDAPVRPGREHVVVAWPIERDGRKLRAGSALLSADGEPLAVAEVLLIEPHGGR